MTYHWNRRRRRFNISVSVTIERKLVSARIFGCTRALSSLWTLSEHEAHSHRSEGCEESQATEIKSPTAQGTPASTPRFSSLEGVLGLGKACNLCQGSLASFRRAKPGVACYRHGHRSCRTLAQPEASKTHGVRVPGLCGGAVSVRYR